MTGATVWLTGLPSAGKSTVAAALGERLAAEGHRVEVLDGDAVRTFLTAGLGYSREDRDTNIERIGYVAQLLSRHGVVTLVAAIAPYADTRERVRKRHEAEGTAFVEVYVATPLAECQRRDVKGLYGQKARGELTTALTGVDDPYEVPERPDVVLTTSSDLASTVAELHAALRERGLV
jgi:adenylylsulfate kinase